MEQICDERDKEYQRLNALVEESQTRERKTRTDLSMKLEAE